MSENTATELETVPEKGPKLAAVKNFLAKHRTKLIVLVVGGAAVAGGVYVAKEQGLLSQTEDVVEPAAKAVKAKAAKVAD